MGSQASNSYGPSCVSGVMVESWLGLKKKKTILLGHDGGLPSPGKDLWGLPGPALAKRSEKKNNNFHGACTKPLLFLAKK